MSTPGSAYIPEDELKRARRAEFILENATQLLRTILRVEGVSDPHEHYCELAVDWAALLYEAIERDREDTPK